MKKYPTAEQRHSILEKVFDRVQYSPVTPMLLLNIEAMIQNEILELVHRGEISKTPVPKVTKTVIGHTVNENMQWVPVYNNTSITVDFLDPDTRETV